MTSLYSNDLHSHRSLPNRAPSECAATGDSHHGCAAKHCVTLLCQHGAKSEERFCPTFTFNLVESTPWRIWTLLKASMLRNNHTENQRDNKNETFWSLRSAFPVFATIQYTLTHRHSQTFRMWSTHMSGAILHVQFRGKWISVSQKTVIQSAPLTEDPYMQS